jgi:hypothetical protein
MSCSHATCNAKKIVERDAEANEVIHVEYKVRAGNDLPGTEGRQAQMGHVMTRLLRHGLVAAWSRHARGV